MESLEQVRKAIRFKPTKTDKARGVALPAFAVTEFRRWKREQAEELLALGIRQGGDTLVCGKANGAPHLPQSITFEFNGFIERLALPRVTFHGLRHGHATQLLASGVHPKIAQERLGHSTISTTLDLYSHVTDTRQAEAAEKLNAVWLGSKLGNEPQAAKDDAKK